MGFKTKNQRWWLKISPPDLLRFFRLLVKREDGCWLWIGASCMGSSGRYGNFSIRGLPYSAHRVSYLAFVGSIDKRKQIDHICRNTLCVNPAHLRQVTPKENTLCGVGPSAINAKKTHCKNGHLLSKNNLCKSKLRTTSARQCRICRNDYHVIYRKKRKAILIMEKKI